MYVSDSDAAPVYSLVQMDDLIVVGAISGYEKLRKILGDKFLVRDTGSLKHEGSKLGFLGRIRIWMGDEVHVGSSKGYIDGLLEVLHFNDQGHTWLG